MNTTQAKTHARRLSAFLKAQGITLPYAACLEAIAHTEGVANWQTLEAQKPVISVNTAELSGAPVVGFFELPFLHPVNSWPLIEKILVASTLAEQEAGTRTYHDLNIVNEELFEIMASEARGEVLDDAEAAELADEADSIVLDWGDEYDSEGLTVAELRGIVQVGDSTWKLVDGRTVELFASAKVSVPMPAVRAPRKPR